MTQYLVIVGGELPRAPRKPSARAKHAVDLYRRMMARPQWPERDAKRLVLSRRLDAALRMLSPKDLASYYAGIAEETR